MLAGALDLLVPGSAVLVLVRAAGTPVGGTRTVLVVVAALAWVGWGCLVWGLLARRGASPGLRLARLRLVGLPDRRPLGPGRVLVRQLLVALLALTGVGLAVMAVRVARHPQGRIWPDLVVGSAVVTGAGRAPGRLAAPNRRPGR